FKERVATIDDDVPGFEVRQEMFDEFVDWFAGLDHQHHATGALERRDHFLDGMGADNFRALGFFGKEFIHLFDGAVESDHGETVIIHVQNQILAHHGQTDHCNISIGFHFRYLSGIRAIAHLISLRYKSRHVALEDFLANAGPRLTAAWSKKL